MAHVGRRHRAAPGTRTVSLSRPARASLAVCRRQQCHGASHAIMAVIRATRALPQELLNVLITDISS